MHERRGLKMGIGMAVNSGSIELKQELAELLATAAKHSFEIGLWVDGKAFDVTLRQVVAQLKDSMRLTS